MLYFATSASILNQCASELHLQDMTPSLFLTYFNWLQKLKVNGYYKNV